MRKLLTIIAALIICNAYGEAVYWMVDNSVSSVSGCEASGNITKPSNPTKTGYKFIGWKEDDTSFIATYVTNNGTSSTPTSTGTGSNTWTTTYSWGTVTGAWRCSTDSAPANNWNDSTGAGFTTNANPTLADNGCGTNNNPGCPNQSVSGNKARNCWCKMTNFAGKSVSSLAWVFVADRASPGTCASSCAFYCGFYSVQTYFGFRRALFGVAGS